MFFLPGSSSLRHYDSNHSSLPLSMPQVPYYAVIFTSKRQAKEGDGYPEMAEKMDALAKKQAGFLGIRSVSEVLEESPEGYQLRSGITISYWKDEESIGAWKRNLEHLLAQQKGKNEWYLNYEVRVSRVEREYFGGLEGHGPIDEHRE
ncbi:hypothetical protein FB45DRAFT_313822 [Roridomyces roridus]|uniref:ABM domain-containing protein n=1 Tax=Roridomyces roridus TaxID=1738132 RepID=A0AAD7B5W3_9AGAR|nr:hypothetical protein FB45DRAFT_313822 [Roridomyces roridus]